MQYKENGKKSPIKTVLHITCSRRDIVVVVASAFPGPFEITISTECMKQQAKQKMSGDMICDVLLCSVCVSGFDESARLSRNDMHECKLCVYVGTEKWES